MTINNIRKRVILGFSLVIMLTVVMSYIEYNQLIRINQITLMSTSWQTNKLVGFIILLDSIDDDVKNIIEEGVRERIIQNIKKASVILNTIKKNADGGDIESKAEELETFILELETEIQVLINLQGNNASPQEIQQQSELVTGRLENINMKKDGLVVALHKQLRDKSIRQKGIIKTAVRQLIFLTTFVLIIGIITALIISHSISEPIIKLRNANLKVSKGNLNVKIKVKSKDEIGELANSFNKMVKDLKKSKAEIEKRTKELQKSKKELKSKMEKLEKFNKFAIGRELKMVELKKKLKELSEK